MGTLLSTLLLHMTREADREVLISSLDLLPIIAEMQANAEQECDDPSTRTDQ